MVRCSSSKKVVKESMRRQDMKMSRGRDQIFNTLPIEPQVLKGDDRCGECLSAEVLSNVLYVISCIHLCSVTSFRKVWTPMTLRRNSETKYNNTRGSLPSILVDRILTASRGRSLKMFVVFVECQHPIFIDKSIQSRGVEFSLTSRRIRIMFRGGKTF